MMKFPAIFQREARTCLLQGVALGAVATMTIGFIWGGWVTEESARIMRAAAENSGRMSILVPLCVAQFTAADGAMAKFKTSSVYSREDLVSDVVKNVASTNMDYALAKACASSIDLELAKAATKS
jgi:hypothetical protein